MSEMDFYGGDQMDPLGTANNAAAQQTGTGTTGEPVIGKLPKNAGAKKEKPPMSTPKKVGIALGVMFLAALILSSLAGNEQPAPKINPQAGHVANDVSPASATVTPAGAMMGAQTAPDAATVMGGDAQNSQAPAGVQAQPAAPAQAASDSGAPTAANAAAAPVPTAPAPLPAGAGPAPQPQAAAPAVQGAPKPQSAEQPKADTERVAQSTAASSENAKLQERVTDLERKLAKLEQVKSTRAPAVNASAVEEKVAPRVKNARVPKSQPSGKTNQKPLISEQTTAAANVASQIAPAPEVRVLGTTTRQGTITALISVGGTNVRVAEGQLLPGVGVVSKIGADAAGNAYADINGVKYQ